MTTGQTSTIYTGQLAVDFYDSTNRDLVWRGVVSKTIDTKAKPEKQQKNLTKAVAKLRKKYPPPPPKSSRQRARVAELKVESWSTKPLLESGHSSRAW